MTDMLTAPLQAFRARGCITMAGQSAASGQALFEPLAFLDNALLVTGGGRVHYVGRYAEKWLPAGVKVHDLGDRILVPAAVNAHTHLQLSYLAGSTLWGQGFVPWLSSLIPLLRGPLEFEAIRSAAKAMYEAGSMHSGDFTSHGMAMVGQAMQEAGLTCTLLVEHFGFAPLVEGPWPERAKPGLEQTDSMHMEWAAPCGHALYSTSAQRLQTSLQWCERHNKPFAMHLAEFPEETEALTQGRGPLVDLYTPVVLSPEWRAPGLAPVPLAEALGLLTPHTLAVHCVHCDAHDRRLLASRGVNVCLCPRSNANLGVGEAPAKALAHEGVLLCLGTDGLTSNTDLDVWQEAVYLREHADFSVHALLRMLTSNGAWALRLHETPALYVGGPAQWTVLPQALC